MESWRAFKVVNVGKKIRFFGQWFGSSKRSGKVEIMFICTHVVSGLLIG